MIDPTVLEAAVESEFDKAPVTTPTPEVICIPTPTPPPNEPGGKVEEFVQMKREPARPIILTPAATPNSTRSLETPSASQTGNSISSQSAYPLTPLTKTCHTINWTRIPATASRSGIIPTPRHGHRAVVYKHYIIFFSGGNEGIIDGVNVFNTISNEWSQPTVKGTVPAGRALFGMAIDGVRILVHGGMLEYSEYTNEMFELNVQKWEWTQLFPKARSAEEYPCPRIGHSFTIVKERAFVFGGLSDVGSSHQPCPNFLNDTYVLMLRMNNQNGTWLKPAMYGQQPSPRESHTAVAYTSKDQRHNKIVIFGGMNGLRLSDMFSLDVDTYTWTYITCERLPRPRSLHTATVVFDRMYVFGGWIPSETETGWPSKVDNNTFCLNLRTMVWESVQEKSYHRPPARSGHSAVNVCNRIYVFGGREGFLKDQFQRQKCLNDMWVLDVTRPTVIPGKVNLVQTKSDGFRLSWNPVLGATGYILQCQKYTAPVQVAVIGDTYLVENKRPKLAQPQPYQQPLRHFDPANFRPVQTHFNLTRMPRPRAAFAPLDIQQPTPMSFQAFQAMQQVRHQLQQQRLPGQSCFRIVTPAATTATTTVTSASRFCLTGSHGIPSQFSGQAFQQIQGLPRPRYFVRNVPESITVPIRVVEPQLSVPQNIRVIRRPAPSILSAPPRPQPRPPTPPDEEGTLVAAAEALLRLGSNRKQHVQPGNLHQQATQEVTSTQVPHTPDEVPLSEQATQIIPENPDPSA